MMRLNNLMEPIAAPDNLRLAFWKAQKGKTAVMEVQRYRDNLDANLLSLHQQLLTSQVVVGNYNYFTIYDPKERRICAAPFAERVLHHAIMNIAHPVFERYQVYDSYASRPGKGTHAAVLRACTFQQRHRWFSKLDIRKYFDTINHQVVAVQLARLFKDKRLLQLFARIVDTYAVAPGCGLPIGNLTSQYLANHYLAVADHYARELLRVPGYARYMDDMVLWHNTKQQLQEATSKLIAFIEHSLLLSVKPPVINQSRYGLPFLGFVVFPATLHLNQNSRQRFKRKLSTYTHRLATGRWSQAEYQKHVMPLLSFVNRADSGNFRKKILTQNPTLSGWQP